MKRSVWIVALAGWILFIPLLLTILYAKEVAMLKPMGMDEFGSGFVIAMPLVLGWAYGVIWIFAKIIE